MNPSNGFRPRLRDLFRLPRPLFPWLRRCHWALFGEGGDWKVCTEEGEEVESFPSCVSGSLWLAEGPQWKPRCWGFPLKGNCNFLSKGGRKRPIPGRNGPFGTRPVWGVEKVFGMRPDPPLLPPPPMKGLFWGRPIWGLEGAPLPRRRLTSWYLSGYCHLWRPRRYPPSSSLRHPLCSVPSSDLAPPVSVTESSSP